MRNEQRKEHAIVSSQTDSSVAVAVVLIGKRGTRRAE